MTESDICFFQGIANDIMRYLSRAEIQNENEEKRATLERARFKIFTSVADATQNVVSQLDNEQPKPEGVVIFTEKEVNELPKKIRRLIIVNKNRCRLRSHASGKNGLTYEIRFRRNGYDVSACGKTIELAKENFIKKMKTAEPKKTDNLCSFNVPTTFTQFATYYFENYRKIKVSELTYSIDKNRFDRHIAPYFKEKPINKITPRECQELIKKFTDKGQGKTAEEIFGLMNVTFKCAILHGIIERNPLDILPRVEHECQSGCALSKSEEKILFDRLEGADVRLAVALMLYCGLRPNEVPTAVIDGAFIKAVNSKRKTKKVQYKRIPIFSKLRPFLPADGIMKVANHDRMRKRFKEILPEHKTYDLRTTFYTRCDELGVATPARDEFVGHSSGALTNAYRDLSDEYLLKEGKKLDEW